METFLLILFIGLIGCVYVIGVPLALYLLFTAGKDDQP